ncbi:MAG: hypothetical protein WAM28_03275 [Chlamydiales bacterium]
MCISAMNDYNLEFGQAPSATNTMQVAHHEIQYTRDGSRLISRIADVVIGVFGLLAALYLSGSFIGICTAAAAGFQVLYPIARNFVEPGVQSSSSIRILPTHRGTNTENGPGGRPVSEEGQAREGTSPEPVRVSASGPQAENIQPGSAQD